MDHLLTVRATLSISFKAHHAVSLGLPLKVIQCGMAGCPARVTTHHAEHQVPLQAPKGTAWRHRVGTLR